MKQYISKSADETKAIGAKLAKEIPYGVIALSGELGAGKTTFVQGFAQGLGIKEKILSPTFVLIRQQRIVKRNQMLYHIDLYRLEGGKYFPQLGLKEIINNPNHLILIEWAEKIEEYLPSKTFKIFIEKKKDDIRLITVS